MFLEMTLKTLNTFFLYILLTCFLLICSISLTCYNFVKTPEHLLQHLRMSPCVHPENLGRLKKLEYLNLALNNIELIENLEGEEVCVASIGQANSSLRAHDP